MPKGLLLGSVALLLLEPLARTPAHFGGPPGPTPPVCGVVKNTSTCCSPDASGSCRGWGSWLGLFLP